MEKIKAGNIGKKIDKDGPKTTGYGRAMRMRMMNFVLLRCVRLVFPCSSRGPGIAVP